MRRVAMVLLPLLAIASIVGCDVGRGDSFQRVPQSIAGETLVYDMGYGPEAHDWAKEVWATTGLPILNLTSATGFTFPDDNEYQSHVLRIVGTDGQQLIEPFIEALTGNPPTDIWQEQIGGKAVTRWVVCCGLDRDQASYAYAFEDIAILILTRRPQEAEEAIRAMP